MSISNQLYAYKMGEYGERVKKAGEEYAEIPKKVKLENEKDLVNLRKLWLLKVDDFRGIQRAVNELEIPKGFETDGRKLREAYKKYVDCIEEKTRKFGKASSGEIETIQKLELEAAQEIKRLSIKLGNEMFK